MAASFQLKDWAHVRTGDRVAVRMGAGWERGTLVRKYPHAAMVQLKARMVSCFDPRNVKKA